MLQFGEFVEPGAQRVANFKSEAAPSPALAVLEWRKTNHIRRLAIEGLVSRIFDVPPNALRSSTRGRAHVALARQAAMYLAHVVCGLSMTEVGRIFERDRTTVAHACALIEDRRDDVEFDQLLELLERIAREEIRRRLGDKDAIVAYRPDERRP